MDFSNTGISFNKFPYKNDMYGLNLVEAQYAIGVFLSFITCEAAKKQVKREALEISGPLNIVFGLTDDLLVVGINNTKATTNSKTMLSIDQTNTKSMSIKEIENVEKDAAREVIGSGKLNFFYFPRTALEILRDMVTGNATEKILVDINYYNLFKKTNEWIKNRVTGPTSKAYILYNELIKSADKYVSTIQKGLDMMEFNPKFRARNMVVKQNMGFYVLPFTDSPEQSFEAIKQGIADSNIDCNIVKSEDRFDPSRSNNIIENIWQDICTARFVIADLSERNPNVFYELGICDAIGKKVISICSEKSKKNDYHAGLPFDVAGDFTIFYTEDWKGRNILQQEVVKRIRAILEMNSF